MSPRRSDSRARWRRPSWLALALLAAGPACTPSAPDRGQPELAPCRLEPLGTQALCTTHRVFEDRAAQVGRQIELRIAVLPALARRPEPDPLVVLVGGPGQAATEAGAQIAEALREVRRLRDVVLVDQRGTGASHPLDCDDDEASLEERFAPRLDLPETRACLAALDADPRAYATPTAMADLEEVRQLLGYEQLNLWGGSYGSRAALVYYRQYPQRVRSLVLDGAAPPWLELQLLVPRKAQRALDLVLSDCHADAGCRRAFPDVRTQLSELLSQLEGAPRTLRVLHPRTHETTELTITREGFAMALMQALYTPELARLLPLAISRAHGGDYGAIIATTGALSDSLEVASGMFLSVICAEDIRRLTPEKVQEMTQGTFLGATWLERTRAQCAEWPHAALPDAYFEPVHGDVPALILSGHLDPVTPPVWGEEVARALPRSRHVVVGGAGHGVSGVGCMPEVIAAFLEAGSAEGLELECLERVARPAFFTSLAGPPP